MDKDNKHHGSRTIRLPRWFSRKHKGADPFQLSVISDGGEENDDYMDGVADGSSEMDPCISTNELRVFIGTWNVAGRSPVGSLAVDLDEWLNLKDAADIYVLGFQEIVPLKAKTVIGAEDPREATNWNLLIGKTLNNKYGCPWLTPLMNPITAENNRNDGIPNSERQPSISGRTTTPMRGQQSKYKLMASKKMVGVFISVWMRGELIEKYNIAGVKVCSVACGIMGYLGNKGSVSISMSIDGTSFCFIAAHLASGEKKGDEGRRNHQVSEIFRRTYFPRLPEDGDNLLPLTILGHDRIFWFGDLNYRLYLEDNMARHFIRQQDWIALQKFDQLQRELDDGGVFQGWKEGNIEFAPTYKYSSSNCNRYSGAIPSRAGEKQRTPAWCDRILWYGKGVRQLSYFRSESKFSDHRPVSALFCTRIEVVKSGNPRFPTIPTTFLPRTPSKNHGQERATGEVPSTLLSLIVRDVEVSPTYMQACISSR
ncbi:type I inositol polyphosphate 5-phosphatase 4-like [Olea europaea var. sylvestris]|uniref:type I inositol polyphosphate 5-phosphatase 4-like n=1 Tax=Olea europaea var. sylvestris TaxID=158386 RepID=UPI000C1D3014|nr:type I inositol polyphosphate 5-phosphatase 4-like [Olea europaea var. sylvestris]